MSKADEFETDAEGPATSYPDIPEEYRLDKTAFSNGRLEDEPDERAFWFSKTPEERLRAAEFLRQQLYGYDPATLGI